MYEVPAVVMAWSYIDNLTYNLLKSIKNKKRKKIQFFQFGEKTTTFLFCTTKGLTTTLAVTHKVGERQ
jgi:hypothetical protein